MDLSYDNGYFAKDKLRYHGLGIQIHSAADQPSRRTPDTTIRLRFGRKMLRHGLRQGWRIDCGRDFPVTVTKRGGDGG